MKLTWIKNNFICKDLYAPFILDRDEEYLNDLSKKYNIILKQAIEAGADEESIKIIKKYKKKIRESLKCYYRADMVRSNSIIRNLLKDVGDNHFAVSNLDTSCAFAGDANDEIQFFRCRTGNPSNSFSAREMMYLPISLRSKSGNYRFSIPGNPSLYLANSSYGCWIETGFPADIDFNVSPVLLDGKQKILNLVVGIRYFSELNELEDTKIHIWLKLLMLMIATSYRIKESNRTFKSEYIISQSIMMACKKLEYDGIAYYSKRVADEAFARSAINLVLFVDYENEDKGIARHMKIDDAFNYSVYKNLLTSSKVESYNLRSIRTPFINNIGSYDRQYPYRETEFCKFDQFLFSSWYKKRMEKIKMK